MSSLFLGLLCALAAATCYGAGPLIQALGARQTPTGTGLGLGLLARLARNKLWLAGVGTDLGGFGFEAVALALAPAAFVTPLLLFDMVVIALLASRIVKERMTVQGYVGIAVIITGGVLLTVAFATSHHGVGQEASTAQQLVLAAVVAGTAVGALVVSRFPASGTTTALLAAGSGISYAAATLCTRQISLSLREHSVWHQLATPAPYVLTVAALLSLSLLSRALQTGAAIVAVPLTSAFAALLPAAAGLALFSEPVPQGVGLVFFLLSLPLLVTGLILIARQRTVSDILTTEARQAAKTDAEPVTPAVAAHR